MRTRRRSLLGEFVYGIPELNREAIRGAKAVAAAGCYATAAILALKPLVDAGLVKPDSLIVDAASGVSGAGREAKEATGFSTVDGSFSAYGLLNHRHTAEMEMAIGGTVLFTPAPGADDPRHPRDLLRRRRPAPCDPLEALRDAYADEPFVHVTRPAAGDQVGERARTAPSSPPATTSAPAASSRCPRSTISARARRAR